MLSLVEHAARSALRPVVLALWGGPLVVAAVAWLCTNRLVAAIREARR